jgi:hypothetical protein
VHHGNCNKKIQHDLINAEPILLSTIKSPKAGPAHAFTCHTLIIHLITFIGIENIRNIACENKATTSSTGDDPTTLEFLDNKYKKVTLEALLALEDNFGKLSDESLEIFSFVSLNF